MARKLVVTNAFSINMLAFNEPHAQLGFFRITIEEARTMLNHAPWSSAIGHAETAKVVSATLGTEVPMNRVNVVLKNDSEEETELLIAQYVGPRLAEGALTLPEGARIDWFHVFRI